MSETTTDAAAEWVSPEELTPWPGNPRRNDDSVQSVADSIARFGFGAPIVARLETREIIAGHTRWKAAQQLKLDRVPVRFLDISEREAHLLALADNRMTELTPWDAPMLAEALSEFSFEDVELAGWDGEAIEKLASGAMRDGKTYEVSDLDPHEEWDGMPEFEQPDNMSHRRIIVHFASDDDVDAFGELIGQTFTDKTKSIWHPKAERNVFHDKAYVDDPDAVPE